jgi:hypothetical protein
MHERQPSGFSFMGYLSGKEHLHFAQSARSVRLFFSMIASRGLNLFLMDAEQKYLLRKATIKSTFSQ